MPKVSYKSMVTEAKRLRRELDREHEPRQWRLAELSYMAVLDPPPGVDKVTRQRWAEAIGVSATTAGGYVNVWKAYRDGRRRPERFMDAWVEALSGPAQLAATREVADRRKTSLVGARDRHRREVTDLRKALEADPAVTREVLADPALVKAALADPDVRREVATAVVRDRGMGRDLDEAVSEARREKWAEQHGRPDRPPLERKPDDLDLAGTFTGHCSRAQKELRAALAVLIDSDVDLDDVWRETFLVDVERTERLVGGLRAWLSSGGATDAALADLLAEGAA